MSITPYYLEIDIIIPTLNSDKVLEFCLKSIRKQKYPQNNIHILLIDGGSTDNTISIAKKYQSIIFSNKLKTGEAGKAVGIKKAKSEYIALIDSDNILPSKYWLKKMLIPFIKFPKIIGTEPWAYTYRKKGGFIERYASLTGVNDPYTLIAGNFDRINYLYPGWTNLNINITNHRDFQIAIFDSHKPYPTMGANGTIFKRQIFNKFNQNYYFDIDIFTSLKNPIHFAKVKTSIIHTYCESSISKFIRKQFRRITDYFTYYNYRTHPLTKSPYLYSIKFILYTILIIPVIYHTILGFSKKFDLAWLFHPIACIITLYCYILVSIKYRLGILKPLTRTHWSQ